MMRNKTNLAVLFLGLSGLLSAQNVGINTETPVTTLHIEGSSKTAPTYTDGILVPKVSKFPTETDVVKGMLVFLEVKPGVDVIPNPSKPTEKVADPKDNFYFYDGEKWIPFIRDFNKELDENIYSFNGNGMNGNPTTGGRFIFTDFHKKTKDGFSISDNTITVGKKGTYNLNFFTSIIRKNSPAPSSQANYNYTIEISRADGSRISLPTATSYPNQESTSGANLSYSNIVELAVGDKIFVTGKGDGTDPKDTFEAYGNNNMILTFLYDEL